MRSPARPAPLVAVTLVALLASSALAQAAAATPDLSTRLLQFVGRLHPILVHFPIAMVIVAAMIEVVRAAFRRPGPARTTLKMFAIGVIGSGIAILSGWFNGDYENHASVADTMELHRWIAIGGGSAALLALLIGIPAGEHRRMVMAFRSVLLVSAAAIGFAGHLGGTMVYGDDYLFAPFRTAQPRAVPEPTSGGFASTTPVTAATVSFARDVLPIFETHCIECHGAGRARAGMRLDSLDHALSVDDWIIAPGDPDASDLVDRITLPVETDGAMPPKGDRLTSGEINAVTAWISSLAPASPAAESTPGESGALSTPESGEADAEFGPGELTAAGAHALEEIRRIGGRIEPIAADSIGLDVNLALAEGSCTDAVLASLAPLASRIKWLDCSGAPITDAGLRSLGALTALERLNLTDTPITDAGFTAVASLPNLRILNITGTFVTDAALASPSLSPSLSRIYAWRSVITPAGVERAAGSHPSLTVILGADDQWKDWAPPAEPAAAPSGG